MTGPRRSGWRFRWLRTRWPRAPREDEDGKVYRPTPDGTQEAAGEAQGGQTPTTPAATPEGGVLDSVDIGKAPSMMAKFLDVLFS